MPERAPIFTVSACVTAILLLLFGIFLQSSLRWNSAQRAYFGNYILASTLGRTRDTGHYRFWTYTDSLGVQYVVTANELELVKMPDGHTDYRITEEGRDDGAIKVEIQDGRYLNSWMRRMLRDHVYQGSSLWGCIAFPAYGALLLFLPLLAVAVRLDADRARIRMEGRRLRGPEMVEPREFVRRLGADGIGIDHVERSWVDRVCRRLSIIRLSIPKLMEACHVALIGDTGSGKSTLITQILICIFKRSERAIVLDLGLDYLPHFLSSRPGSVIIGFADERCPALDLPSEISHPSVARAIAVALIPMIEGSEQFFRQAAQRILESLLLCKPTTDQLASWLRNPVEIDHRVRGSELAVLIDHQAPAQRAGVLATLSFVGEAFSLLPTKSEAKHTFSTLDYWKNNRTGCIFFTAPPMMREQSRPIISMLFDLLILRSMTESTDDTPKTWFVIDDLGGLQRLPQLVTALTEGRKYGNPLVLGYQGQSQLQAIYGRVAEAMISQPATKVYLRTSEPNAAEWVSRAIGDVEVERVRESESYGENNRSSRSEQTEIVTKRLVMAAEVAGLQSLHGYVKHGNIVTEFETRYLTLPKRDEAFVQREITLLNPPPDGDDNPPASNVGSAPAPKTPGNIRQLLG